MNEEKYTRDKPKKSANKRRVEPENKTTEKRHGNKLKNETSAGESYRKKLRYGKKDNSLTLEEKKKLCRCIGIVSGIFIAILLV